MGPGDGSSWCSTCSVIEGFKNAYNEVHDEFVSNIREIGCKHISLTGHSLGGAIATMATLELRANFGFHAAPLYTFGAPRVGDSAFAHRFIQVAHKKGIEPPSWRVVH